MGIGLALDVHVVDGHLPAVQYLHFNLRLRMLLSAKVLIDAHGRSLAVANAVDDEAWSERTIAAGEDPGRRGHQRVAIYTYQPAWRNQHPIFRPYELQIRSLADRENDGVAVELGIAILVEGWIETAVLVEDVLGLQALEADDSAVASENTLRSVAGMHDDAFGFRLLDFLQRGRHLIAVFQADKADFACAHTQRGERNIHHFVRCDGLNIFF